MRALLPAVLALTFLAGPGLGSEEEPRLGGDAARIAKNPKTIADARLLAVDSPYDADVTADLLSRMSAYVENDEYTLRAAELALDVGLPALDRLMEIHRTAASRETQARALNTMWKLTPRMMRTPAGLDVLEETLAWLESTPADGVAAREGSYALESVADRAGPGAVPLLPRIAKLAHHDSPHVRRAALLTISNLRRWDVSHLGLLLPALADPDPEVRIAVLYRLPGESSLAVDLLERFEAALDDKDKDVRRVAKIAVNRQRSLNRKRMGPSAPPPPTYPTLTDGRTYYGVPNEGGPEPAPSAESETEPEPELPTDVPALVDLLGVFGRTDAAESRLASLGPKARGAIPLLILHLDDRERVRAPSVRLLAQLGGDDPEVIAELAAVVEGLCPYQPRSHFTREETDAHAAQALGRLGARAAAALPALRRATRSSNRTLRETARVAVAAIEAALRPGEDR